MMQRRPDPPYLEMGQHHVGPPDSVHAPYPADDLSAKVNALAAMLKLQWCAQCQTYHEIAGGSEKARDNYAGMRQSDSMAGSDPPGI